MARNRGNDLIFLVGLLMIVTSGCTSFRVKSLTPDEYVTFLNSDESGMKSTSVVNNIRYQSILVPSQYLVIKHSKDSIKTQKDFEHQLDYYIDQLNVILLISDAGQKNHVVKKTIFDSQKYNSIIAYVNSEMKNDFMLVQDNDTIYTSLLHIESSNSVEPLLRLSLGFTGVNPKAKDVVLVFSDNIFENGFIKFNYASALSKLPEIKI
jgi:hypothetical protein